MLLKASNDKRLNSIPVSELAQFSPYRMYIFPSSMTGTKFHCPLHDVSKHIENTFEELPAHLDRDDALLFTETVEAAHGYTEVI